MKIALIGGEAARSNPLASFARDDGHDLVDGDTMDAEAIWWLGAAADDRDAAALATIRDRVGRDGIAFLACGAGHLGLALALGGACDGKLETGPRQVLLTEAGAGGVLMDGVAEPLRVSGGPARQISRLPEGARCLATSQACPVEAMLFGTRAFSTHAALGTSGGYDEAAAERIYINWFQAAARA